MVLNASYVCLLHSRFVENHPIWILEEGPLISEVVLSQLVSVSYKIYGGQDHVFRFQGGLANYEELQSTL
jgi:hypothetical protein